MRTDEAAVYAKGVVIDVIGDSADALYINASIDNLVLIVETNMLEQAEIDRDLHLDYILAWAKIARDKRGKIDIKALTKIIEAVKQTKVK